MTDPIAIKVTDGIDDSIRQKLLNIASAALEGYNSVQKLNDQLASIDTSSVDKLTKSLAANESATTKANLSYLAQETALNKAIAAEDKAATAALQLSTAQGKAQAAADKLAAAHEAASESVNAFGETEAAVAARLASVASAGAALAKSQQSISITATEASNSEKTLASSTTNSGKAASDAANRYTNYMSALNTINKSGAQGINATSDALKESADSAGKASIANAGVTRELIVLGHEAITGNFSRIPGSLLVLAERTGGFAGAIGLLTSVFTPLNIVIGLVVGALAAYEIAVSSSDKQTRDFNNTLALTQGASGLTIDSYNALATATANANNVSINSSKALINQLEKGGSFQADQIAQLADATIKLSKLSGDSTDKIISDFKQLTDAPSKYAEELQKAYGIVIAPAIQEQVKLLEDQGQKSEATRVLTKALYDYLQQNAPQALTGLTGLWDRLGVSISNALGKFSVGIASLKNGGSLPDQIAEIQAGLTELEKFKASNDKQAKIGGPNSAAAQQSGDIDDRIKEQQDLLDSKLGEVNTNTVLAQQQSDQTAKLKDSNDAAKSLAATILTLKTNGQKANEEIEKFETNFYNAINNPATQNLASTQYSATHFQQIEDALRAKYEKAPKAVPASDDEKRDAILTKVNNDLAKQLDYYGDINTVRAAGQALDAIDNKLASHTKGGKLDPLKPLTDQERSDTAAKLGRIQLNKQVEASEDAIYSSIIGPEQQYILGLDGVNELLTRNYITSDQAATETLKLSQAYLSAVDPLYQFNKQLDQQNALLESNKDANQRAVSTQITGINNGLQAAGKPTLTGSQQDNVAAQITKQQQLNQITQQYDQIIAQNKGAYDALDTQQLAYNKALDAGRISVETYSNATTQLAIARANLRLKSGSGNQDDLALASVGKLLDGYQNVLTSLSKSFGDFFTTIDNGFADSIGKWIVEGGSLKDMLVSVAQQGVEALISSLIKVGVQYLLNQALQQASTTAAIAGEAAKSAAVVTGAAVSSGAAVSAMAVTTTASVASAGTTATAWAPAAALASLGSFGTAAVLALAGIAAVFALTKGFAGGGYTGNGGIGNVAGVVHGKEFVMNATATAQNRATLEAMNAGQNVGGSGGGGSAPTIIIENHGTPQTYQTQSVSRDEIRMIARDEVATQAPKVISGELGNQNSQTSKSLKSNFQVQANR